MNKFAFAFLAPVMILASPASATITIAFQNAAVNGGAVTTVATDSGSGLASFTGAYGSFTTLVSAFGSPLLPQPILQTNGISVSSTIAGMLTVYVTQQNLTASTAGLTSSFTSNSFTGSAQSVVESTYYSASNELFGGTQLASALFTGIGTVVSTDALVGLSGPYSQTAKYVIAVGDGTASVNNTINLSAPAAVPEPATWAMMIVGFGAVGSTMRRRRTSVRFA
ncbi:PEPxxWA-CTERM sorting domain-containing protein [Sphingomonas sp. BIUV-7]|uniref:PEPxxWA-CTERM sorting domain-containing protein n=1 Tax=Sphingomonas natans TaxID=3063330 RepID=A0ABT8Y9Y5_9SPHN|nr:PEPxxWA-CTERM sorting domain-containing protein [Sphingomonas sp. BIUV-7]MDO6415143.1 PEPxxWA-CTERM sorting domain-containing protein [Sphingomonas sp. BIUV-7]